jgi:DNA-binding XRE family transcriptional regulator
MLQLMYTLQNDRRVLIMTFQQARIQAGIQVQELANAAKVSRTTIYNLEKNTNIPVSSVMAHKLVNALNRLAGTSYSINDLELNIS